MMMCVRFPLSLLMWRSVCDLGECLALNDHLQPPRRLDDAANQRTDRSPKEPRQDEASTPRRGDASPTLPLPVETKSRRANENRQTLAMELNVAKGLVWGARLRSKRAGEELLVLKLSEAD